VVGLKVNVEKIKYMLLSLNENAGKICDINTANRSFENSGAVSIFGNDCIKSELYSSGN
jgi:hypothetical protein